MRDLPAYRIERSRVFEYTGLGYCGPIKINLNRGRGKPKISKTYIRVFIGISSKAIHLELISDCSTESFLNALKRFVSRRGKPRYIHSDNAKTFVGAEAELQLVLKSTKYQARVVNTLTNDNITFCFIPPSAPHIGDSAVSHLKRVAGNALFSCEEMQTLLTQIEACLNSRPLTTLSSAPNGHVHVVTIKTAVGVLRLPITKVCVLPTNE
jgi:hypothetical protein